MAQYNRVRLQTATTGTGTMTLGAVAASQFCTFAEAGASDGDVIRSYLIEEGGDFEIGIGTYNSAGPTLTRTTVRLSRISSVAGTTKMTLAGNAIVSCVAVKEDLVTQDTSGNVTITGTLGTTGLLTANGGLAVVGNSTLGDIYAARSISTGYLFLGTNAEQYLGFDGTKFQFRGGGIAAFGAGFTSNEAGAILHSGTVITGGGTSNVPTMTSGPQTGNPTKWLPYDDAGVTRYIPAW